MRHQRLRRKLGVNSEHRRALLRNLVKSLVLRKRIRTTLAKAKEASAFADKMVSLGKRGGLHARRLLISELGCADAAAALLKDIVPQFKERHGGYTRVLRLMPRVGDNSKMALLEFTAVFAQPKKAKKAKSKSEKTDAPKLDSPKSVKSEQASVQPDEAVKPVDGKTDPKKQGGFLGSLRKFLKGDE